MAPFSFFSFFFFPLPMFRQQMQHKEPEEHSSEHQKLFSFFSKTLYSLLFFLFPFLFEGGNRKGEVRRRGAHLAEFLLWSGKFPVRPSPFPPCPAGSPSPKMIGTIVVSVFSPPPKLAPQQLRLPSLSFFYLPVLTWNGQYDAINRMCEFLLLVIFGTSVLFSLLLIKGHCREMMQSANSSLHQ